VSARGRGRRAPVAGRGQKKVPAILPPPAGRLSTAALRPRERRRGDSSPGSRGPPSAAPALRVRPSEGAPPGVPVSPLPSPETRPVRLDCRVHAALPGRGVGLCRLRRSEPRRDHLRTAGATASRPPSGFIATSMTPWLFSMAPDSWPATTPAGPSSTNGSRPFLFALNKGGFSLTSENPLYTVCSAWGEDAPGQIPNHCEFHADGGHGRPFSRQGK